MKQFMWNIKCVYYAWKYENRDEYNWYSYLVRCDINNFFDRLKFWRRWTVKNSSNEIDGIDGLPF